MKYLIPSRFWAQPCGQKFQSTYLLAALASIVLWPSPMVQAQTDAISGLVNPGAVAYSPATGKVYTVASADNAIDIADDRISSTKRIKVGAGPVSLAADTENGRVYVANAGDGTVSVVDGKTDVVLATVPVGSHPYSIAADSHDGKVYVSRTYSDQLTILDTAMNAVTGVKTGSPDLIAVNLTSGTVYLLGYEGGDLAIFDGATHDLRKMSVGMHAWGMALNEKTGDLYVARPGEAELAVLEARVGIEPTHKGFADLSLTTWVPRLGRAVF
jgi:YVTN family beta-propeller protein